MLKRLGAVWGGQWGERRFGQRIYASITDHGKFLLPSIEQAETLALALQRVFWRLQTSKTAVSTKELTRAFG
jgi:hypothetical protein